MNTNVLQRAEQLAFYGTYVSGLLIYCHIESKTFY